MLKKLFKQQRGDTILEALIAVAVLSFILSASFILSNRSAQTTRQSQERTEGASATESQLESLKTFISQTVNPSTLPANNTKFCMRADGTPSDPISGIPADAQADDFSSFSSNPSLAGCVKDGLYYSYIERQGDTFTAHTRWFKVGGTTIEEASMVHRIYPDIATVGNAGAAQNTGCTTSEFYNSIFASCVPCPIGYTSAGGFSTACQPIPPQITVIVQKIPPIGNNQTPPCSHNGNAAGGIGVALYGAGGPYTGTSSQVFNVSGFSSLYTAAISPPAGFALCPAPHSQSSVVSSPIGSPAGSNSRTITARIQPQCYVRADLNWRLVPDPNSYYSDIVAYAPYWAQGARAGHKDGFYARGTANGVYNLVDANYWLFHYRDSSTDSRYAWYNAWYAVYVPNPIYGAPYYHAMMWEPYYTYANVCPS